MTLDRLRTLIRIQAKVEGDDNFASLINELIFSTLRNYTQRGKYDELYTQDYSSAVGSGTITLPTDLQILDTEHLRYRVDANDWRYIYPRSRYCNVANGRVNGWVRQGNILILTPNDSIESTDTLLFNYWKDPTISLFTSDSHSFPVPRLEDVVKNDCIAKLASMHSTEHYKIYKREAAESFIASNAAH